VTYFQLQQVHFFASYGIIRIDLPLLLSVRKIVISINKSIKIYLNQSLY